MFDETEAVGHLTLSELAACLQAVLRREFPGWYRVVAEVSELSTSRVGHTYLKLVERGEDGMAAQLDAVVWRDRQEILRSFTAATGKVLHKGMEALFTVRVSFHQVYGLKLNIEGLDADFALGQMARLRKEAIDRLRAEGLMDRNRGLEMPLAPLRIAVVSSRSAAGYQDFVEQLAGSARRYPFTLTLFDAAMQGEGAAAAMIEALHRITAQSGEFDAVALVRGGGSQVDLHCFDDYELARAIAGMPLPVITGIGHERDDSVADMVAHTRVKTPTAAAELLVGLCAEFDDAVMDCWHVIARGASEAVANRIPEIEGWGRRLVNGSERLLGVASAGVLHETHRISTAALERTHDAGAALTMSSFGVRAGVAARLGDASGGVSHLAQRLEFDAGKALDRGAYALETAAQRVADLDPASVLRRGYSITRLHGSAVRNAGDVQPGDEVETRLYRGTLRSTVLERKPPDGEVGTDVR